MPDYSLYRLKPNGEAITPPEEFFATSDEAAIAYAARQTAPHGCEVWSRDRFLAAVARTPDAEPAERTRRWRWPRLPGHDNPTV